MEERQQEQENAHPVNLLDGRIGLEGFNVFGKNSTVHVGDGGMGEGVVKGGGSDRVAKVDLGRGGGVRG